MKARLAIIVPLLFAAAIFFRGISWGLPSGDVNHYLFGNHPVWTGQQIIELAGAWDTAADVGSDVDRNPITKRDTPILLNGTDAQRAEIVRRYRLFSYQPDEMITFRALSQMQPGKGRFDPKLYQYGGLWIYPVGALLKLSERCGLVQLRSDLAFYLDHPEEFGKFYVVARVYSAAWGLAGVLAVFGIVRKLTGYPWWSAAMAMAFAALPVVVCMSHEAKPHLAGASLTLLALWAALRFFDDGEIRWTVLAGVLCGAATAMVVSAGVAFLILPAMAALGPATKTPRMKWLAASLAVGVAVYVVTNPFVVYHLFVDRNLLFSNAGNTSAMYSVASPLLGLANAIRLLGEAAGWMAAFTGFAAWLTLHFTPPALRPRLQLLAAPAIAVVVLVALVGANKPGEYGRFLLLPAALCVIGYAAAFGGAAVRWSQLDRHGRPKNNPGDAGSSRRFRMSRLVSGGALLLVTLFSGGKYFAGFVRDANHAGSRAFWADNLAAYNGAAPRVAIWAEPAPYCLPPMNLFTHELWLQPQFKKPTDVNADIDLRAVDVDHADTPWRQLCATRISWADKPFVVIFGRNVH